MGKWRLISGPGDIQDLLELLLFMRITIEKKVLDGSTIKVEILLIRTLEFMEIIEQDMFCVG
jgi:hypothetical protein